MKKFLFLMICTLFPIFASAQEPYAIFIDNGTALEFRYDNEKAARGGMDIGPFTSMDQVPWHENNQNIYSVIFDSSFANCTSITSTSLWFAFLSNLDYIGGIEYLNTSNVTDMYGMFWESWSITSLDLSSFNTGSVTDMGSMFAGCTALTTIYVSSGWSTASVTNSNAMFEGCTSLMGESGTTYNSSHTDAEYARVDMASSPGYLTGGSGGGGSGEEAQYWMELESTLQYADDVYARARDNSNVEQWMLEELSHYMNRGSDMLDAHEADEEEVHHMVEEINWICWEIEEAMNHQPEPSGNFGSRSLMLWRQVGGKEYRLYKAIDSNQYFTNADGWNMYLTSLTLDIVNGADTTRVTVDDGTLYTSGNIYDNGFFPCMMIDVPNNQIHIFSNSKDGEGSYTMRGYYYLASLDALSFSKEIVYEGANWGWWPQFAGVENGQPILRHFSYAGYFSLTSRRSADGTWSIEDNGDIQPDSYNSMWRDINKVTVIGNAYHDEEVINGVTYTLRNNTDVYISWISNRYDVTEFTIPETVTIGGTTMNVTGIAPYAFYECGQMKQLEIPSSVNYIGDASVMHCGVLESVWSYRAVPVRYTYPVFPDQAYQNATLYVPAGSKANYQATEGWSNFQHIEEFGDHGESEARFDGLTAWVYGDATLDDAFAEVGRESAAQTIAAIVWEGTGALTAEQMQGITNPNLLVYVTEASKAPAGVQNVIVNGTAAQIVLTDASGNNNFFCPEPFTAQSISYTRNFSQTTEIGVSRGWETIALPFNVQSISHGSHGALVPFGGGNGGYPFWLHQLQDNGLTPVTAMEANTPYLICMPNNTVYPSAYNQAGSVTFASSNVTVPRTEPREAFGANVILMPAFQNQAAGPDIFTLNVGAARDSYAEGSVFISNYSDVRPFQAYVHHSNQARGTDDIQFIPLTSIGGGDDTTAIMEIIQPAANGTGDWYSLDGRKLSSKPTQKGIYIQNGKKIVIK